MAKLGVNIDHVATLRQARRGIEPDPVEAALIAEKTGCHSIVAHLREDRRHINDLDIKRLKKEIKTLLNLEMSVSDEIVRIAGDIRPNQATLVPEKRQEITTEGGLDIVTHMRRVSDVVKYLQPKGVNVSLFIDPDKRQIEAAARTGAKIIEIHTGRYANAVGAKAKEKELRIIASSAEFALSLGFVVNAGHGLNYENVSKVAAISGIYELNIGHSIISRAVFSGIENAVEKMLKLIS
ncbi:MAG: pyridoxine 5'-phosphate synthase [Candidatus Omnitrophica bacterium]|nr:pyridoxine 5'-phosphate synthase [Candidatus Omnitrophota bacterium]MBU4487573.1 pyridoxine 5'-phosphate synthase [Candidatus Omnitrophota bacterium]MCG2705589.1 pyridoxine 5'-phosphate synthase [Candidatus Omnitrophota bacterium]